MAKAGFRLLAAALLLACLAAAGEAQQARRSAPFSDATKKLFEAVQQNDLPAVKGSVVAGADLAARNEWGQTAADLAIDKGYYGIAHFLLSVRPAGGEPSPPVTLDRWLGGARQQPAPAKGASPEAAPPRAVPAAPQAAARPTAPVTPGPSAEVAPPPPPPTKAPIGGPLFAPAEGPATAPAAVAAYAPPLPASPPAADASVEPPPGAAREPAAAAPAPMPLPAGPASPPPAKETSKAEPASPSPGFFGRVRNFFTFGGGPKGAEGEPPPAAKPIAPMAAGPPVVEAGAAETAASAPPPARPPVPEAKPAETAVSTPTAAAAPEKREAAAAPASEPGPGFFGRVADLFGGGGTAEKAPADRTSADSPAGAPPAAESAAEPTPAAASPGRTAAMAAAPPAAPPAPRPSAPLGGPLFAPAGDAKPVYEPAPAPEAAAPKPTAAATAAPPAGGLLGEVKKVFGLGGAGSAAPQPAGREQARAPSAAAVPIAAPPTVPLPKPTGKPLAGVVLALDGAMRPGRRLDRVRNPVENCIEKRAAEAWFCVELVEWPAEIAPAFKVSTPIYSGARAVVRYDRGVASQFHALFPAPAFAQVIRHFEKAYGPPTETPALWTAVIGEPKKPNPSVRWSSVDASGEEAVVLEVRAIDDVRGMIPDTEYGVVRLYRARTAGVFDHLSTAELMLVRMRRRGAE